MFLSDKLTEQYLLLQGEVTKELAEEICLKITQILIEELVTMAADIKGCMDNNETIKSIESTLLRMHRTLTPINEKYLLLGDRVLKSDAVLELYRQMNLPKEGYIRIVSKLL